MAFQTNPATADYELEYRLAWSGESCSDTRRLAVQGYHTSGENMDVQVLDSTETTYTTRITITATSDGDTYQTYDLTSDEWDSGDPNARVIDYDQNNEASQHTVYLDDVEIRCVPSADYEVEVKYDWSGVSTTGTEWRLYVEGREGATNPESIYVKICTSGEVCTSEATVCTITSTTEATYDCGTLTVDQLDSGSPSIYYIDSNQASETSQSTFELDYVRIRRSYLYYRLTVGHTWTSSVTTADSYQLRLQSYRSDEDMYIDIYDWQDADWNLMRLTINAGSETLFSTDLIVTCGAGADDCERNSATSRVDIRYRGSDETTSDETQSTVSTDIELIRRSVTSSYEAEVRYDWSGVTTTGTSWTLWVECKRVANPESAYVQVLTPPSTWTTAYTCDQDSDTSYSTYQLDTNELNSGAPAVRVILDASGPDASASSWDLDLVKIVRAHSHYDALVQHDWSAVSLADAYQLRVRAYRSDTENWVLDVYDWDDADWNTAKVTVNVGSETLFTYSLVATCGAPADDCERDDGTGAVRVRWYTTSSTDETLSTLTADQEIVQRTDNDPTLTSPDVNPDTGTSETAFDFSVIYTDLVTCPPGYVRVYLDDVQHALTESSPGDTICVDGKAYDLQPDHDHFCPGTHYYYFTATDSINPEVREPAAGSYTWDVSNIEPAITNGAGAPVDVEHGDPYSYDFDATDHDVDIACQSLTWSKPVGPAWLDINPSTGVLSGTAPHTTGGPYSVTVRASDGTDYDDYPFQVNVTNENPEITNGASAPTTVQHGDPYSYDFDATDADGDTLTWSCPVCPGWLDIDSGTGVLSGTAPHNTGGNSVTVRVEDTADPAGYDEYAYTVTVTNANPVITDPIVSDSGTYDVYYEHDWDATDSDGDTLQWSCVTCRTWMTMDPNTGTLYGTPNEWGTWTITIRVSDNAIPAGTADDSYELTVESGEAPAIPPEEPWVVIPGLDISKLFHCTYDWRGRVFRCVSDYKPAVPWLYNGTVEWELWSADGELISIGHGLSPTVPTLLPTQEWGVLDTTYRVKVHIPVYSEAYEESRVLEIRFKVQDHDWPWLLIYLCVLAALAYVMVRSCGPNPELPPLPADYAEDAIRVDERQGVKVYWLREPKDFRAVKRVVTSDGNMRILGITARGKVQNIAVGVKRSVERDGETP